MDTNSKVKAIIAAAERDGSDEAAMQQVPTLLEGIKAINALWAKPDELAAALAPVVKVMDQVTEFVNNPENHNGRP